MNPQNFLPFSIKIKMTMMMMMLKMMMMLMLMMIMMKMLMLVVIMLQTDVPSFCVYSAHDRHSHVHVAVVGIASCAGNSTAISKHALV